MGTELSQNGNGFEPRWQGIGGANPCFTMSRGGKKVIAEQGKTRLGPMMTREVAIVVVVMMVRTLIA